MTNHLMYDREDTLVNRKALETLPTPVAQGRYHYPYSFYDYVETIEDVLADLKIKIAHEEYALTKDNNRLFGVMEIEPVEGEYISAQEWKYLIGLRGSYDQSISRDLALGTHVTVCSNLCFHGNLATLRTKQTLNVESRIGLLLEKALSTLPEQVEAQNRRFNAYKEFSLPEKLGDSSLVEVYRKGGLSSAQLGRAINEWHDPTFEKHAEDGFTGWRFLNACTEAIKPTGRRSNHDMIMDRTSIVSKHLNTLIGL